MLSIHKALFVALVLRVGIVIYGEWQNRMMEVKFTDIDYKVFSDAAEYVFQGESPYKRETYRYTPLLAYLLVPNHYFEHFGKFLFIMADLLCGLLIYKMGGNSLKCALFWLFDPFVFVISCRGNAEAIVCFLVRA